MSAPEPGQPAGKVMKVGYGSRAVLQHALLPPDPPVVAAPFQNSWFNGTRRRGAQIRHHGIL